MINRLFAGAFFKWIVTFFIVLGSIPILLLLDLVALAKLIGLLTVILTVVALRLWVANSRKKSEREERIRITINDRFWLEKNIPFYKRLSKKDRLIFEDRIGIFIADITITEVNKDKPSKETCFYVASSAIIAFWGLPFWNYGDLHEVLVYPFNFDIDNSLNNLGVVQGKVHHGGLMNNTMILSLPALKLGFDIDNDKKNVGIHEFAHLLDKSDGSINGLPDLLNHEQRNLWISIYKKEMEKMREGKSTIPAYGAYSQIEFFAVSVAYYKECPKLLRRKHPELYNVLDEYFNTTSSLEDERLND